MTSKHRQRVTARRRRRQSIPEPRVAVSFGASSCGCPVRQLHLPIDLVCSACGAPSSMAGQSVAMHTTAPVGSLSDVIVGCPCGSEQPVAVVVRP